MELDINLNVITNLKLSLQLFKNPRNIKMSFLEGWRVSMGPSGPNSLLRNYECIIIIYLG